MSQAQPAPEEPIRIAPVDDAFSNYARHIIQDQIATHQAVSPASEQLLGSSRSFSGPFVPIDTKAHNAAVGVIGAGAGGLYAGMILKSLNIPFEILEASDRTGGRLYTHHFTKESAGDHDYYDVGAMRFPDINIMTRIFNLFRGKFLNSDGIEIKSHLIPFIFSSPNAFLMYNGIRKRRHEVATHSTEPGKVDPFDFGVENGGDVGTDFIYEGSKKLTDDALTPFVTALEADLKSGGSAGWRKLMRFDQYSTRGYMSDCLKYEMPAINWLETMSFSTGWYDQSLVETVLETMAFGGVNPGDVKWWCLDGGSQVLSDKMAQFIEKNPSGSSNPRIKYNHAASSIRAIGPRRGQRVVTMQVGITFHDEATGETAHDVREYDHVISTIPVTTLRTLDLEEAQLSQEQRSALRLLQYAPSTKIGVKFKSAWWKTAKTRDGQILNIEGGQSYSDTCIRTVVYPSYGLPGTAKPTNVLIASFCWTYDAVRLGSMMTGDKVDLARLKELVLRDLAKIHNVDYYMLADEYVDMLPYDWAHNPSTQGAFALFGPGEFSTIYKSLTTFAAAGRLHFAGEALSVRHAWVVGALDSAWRAVKEVLTLSYPEKLKEFYAMWGQNEEWLSHQPANAPRTDFPGGPMDQGADEDLLLRHMVDRNPEFFKEAMGSV